jgi:malate dehydrogenase (oxaloacetate-decarboxylating)
MDDWEIFPREAAAVGMKAQEQGLARLSLSRDELLDKAKQIIQQAQELTRFMMDKGLIPPVPEEWS